jgi:hypothetical protein
MGSDADPPVPEWIVDRAKSYADDGEAWLPYLDVVLKDNARRYGDPMPERDPAAEVKRERAAATQRVLDPGRFTGDTDA